MKYSHSLILCALITCFASGCSEETTDRDNSACHSETCRNPDNEIHESDDKNSPDDKDKTPDDQNSPDDKDKTPDDQNSPDDKDKTPDDNGGNSGETETTECKSGYDRCGKSCVKLLTSHDHCGACNHACKETEQCVSGSCVKSSCKQENTCALECKNTNDACGAVCTDCTQDPNHTGFCIDGVCTYACIDGEYPVFDGDGHSIRCEKASAEACLPRNATSSMVIRNCIASKPDNATQVACSETGECIVSECQPGYHISSDGTACEANDAQKCAPTSTSQTENCMEKAGNAVNAICTQQGTCEVTLCAAGYHISENKYKCEQNTETSCAPADSSDAKSCSSIQNSQCSDAGICECTNPDEVLNFNGTSCIYKACMGVPGVKTAKNTGKKVCFPESCSPGYSLEGTTTWATCSKSCSGYAECSGENVPTGWIPSYTGCKSGMCQLTSSTTKSCSASEGYVYYHVICMPKDTACGSKKVNCLMEGKTCNGTKDTSTCE